MKKIVIYSITILLLTGNAAYAQHNAAIDSLLHEANSYCEQENYVEALAICQKAIAMDSANILVINRLGIIHANMGNYDSAIEYYQKAIELDSCFTPAYYNMGLVYEKQKKLDLAIPWLQKAVDKHPDWTSTTTLELVQAEYHYEKGVVYEQQGDIEKAIEEWTLAAENRQDAKDKLRQYGRTEGILNRK